MAVYLITGGSGFIGSHIAEMLLTDSDHEVRIYDNLSSGHKKNIANLSGQVVFFEDDVRDTQALSSAMAGVDYVFHEAALVSVIDSVHRPRDNHEINLTGTLNVLETAQKSGVKRVVLASSAAIYGNDLTLPKQETMRPQPESPYGLAKIGKEYYARIFSTLYDLPVVALRYFNVYGPRQDPKSAYSGVISIFVDRVLNNDAITIFSDGEQSRDFVFVKDVAKANLLAMHADNIKGGEVFNVATGESVSLLHLLKAIQDIEGSHVTPTFGPERAGDIRHSAADITLAQSILGFKPDYSLSDGLAELVAFCKAEQA
ncbi:MAG: SDR family oxidoreductase [Candidatus Latescibacteria bacterium]|jgi:UDP-glucose 4-epimerase|nr:SDR family oxidoreductase [Candidatus Latescibacterota bacterium]MBT5831514.1 SDR family oxidoreductase [Candidatus Latescibacterota bacterium]